MRAAFWAMWWIVIGLLTAMLIRIAIRGEVP